MSNLPYYKWYPRDFRDATQTWKFPARSVYRELLDLQWSLGYVPDDPKKLRKSCQISLSFWREFSKYFEEKFPFVEGKRRNPRLHEMRREAHRIYESKIEAASKGGKKRQASAQADAQASAKPSASHPEPVLRTGSSYLQPTTAAARRPSEGAAAASVENNSQKEFATEEDRVKYENQRQLIRTALLNGTGEDYLRMRYPAPIVDEVAREIEAQNPEAISHPDRRPETAPPAVTGNGEFISRSEYQSLNGAEQEDDDIPF